ncbi:RpoE-regulated lipoprotein [Entomohabitans teleogrylli]|uniref:RpoE-regulated lipoprotein n=1 Tax=Entomohabitans teleogrylli TaxID=1384589 RepID=UPI00073D4DE5|nr:RpoE-regulated lipoprotein [Entomohabitans teleogrylli]
MKTLRVLTVALPLLLGGCSTLSNIQWSKMAPWNWFGSSLAVSEKGVGGLNALTPLESEAIEKGLGSDYRVRSGMRMENGNMVRYFEALRDSKLAVVVEGDRSVSEITVLDEAIKTDGGVAIGTPFHELYDKAYGACQQGSGDEQMLVVCKAPGSQHIEYLFAGQWRGPEGLMPSDDTLKSWTLNKIVWRR